MIELNSLYEEGGFYSESCWETCGGSHCCKISKITKDMQFAPKDSQVLHLYEFEVDWLRKNNELDPEFEKTLQAYSYRYDDLELKFFAVQCGYNGLCPNHKHRPISCFLYPYIPEFDKNKNIIALDNLSIYDDIYDIAKIEKPCTLYPKFTEEMYMNFIKKHLNFNEFYFYTNLYVKIKRKALQNYRGLRENEIHTLSQNLQAFEMMMAMKRLISKAELDELIAQELLNFPIGRKNEN